MSVLPATAQRFGPPDLEGVPSAPDWVHYVKNKVAKFGRPLKLCCPCIGLNNGGRALKELGIDYELVGSCDVLSHLEEPLEQLEGNLNGIKLGTEAGDILSMDLETLPKEVDILMAGPPCPPFASNGNRNPKEDERTNVFYQVILWIVLFVRRAGLLYALVENVQGCANRLNGATKSFMDILLEFFEQELPEMVWRLDSLNAANYGLAQSRNRVFLQGLRRDVKSSVPAPLPAFEPVSLRDFLKPGLPPTPRDSLTKTMQTNLKNYEGLVRQKKKDGTIPRGSLAVFELDRAFGKTYNPSMTLDMSPCLKTQLRYLFVVSTDDVDLAVAPVVKAIEIRFGTLTSWPKKAPFDGGDLPDVRSFFLAQIPKKAEKSDRKSSKQKVLKKPGGKFKPKVLKKPAGKNTKKKVSKKPKASSMKKTAKTQKPSSGKPSEKQMPKKQSSGKRNTEEVSLNFGLTLTKSSKCKRGVAISSDSSYNPRLAKQDFTDSGRDLIEIHTPYGDLVQSMALPLEDPKEDIFVKAKFCGILGDEKALKESLGVTGSSGTKPCFNCKNIGSKHNDLSDHDYFVSLDCSKFSDLDLHTDSSFREMADLLLLHDRDPTMTKKKFGKLQQVLGLKYDKDTLLFQPDLKDLVQPISCTIWDWMHVLVSHGQADVELGLFVHKMVSETRISIKQLEDFVLQFEGLRQSGGKFNRNFLTSRLKKEGGPFKGFSGELLDLLPLVRTFVDMVLVPSGKMPTHIESFKELCKIVDIMTMGDAACPAVNVKLSYKSVTAKSETQHWQQLRKKNPTEVTSPLRQHLCLWFLKDLQTRAIKVSECKVGDPLLQACMDRKLLLEDMSWPFLKWDPSTKALIIDKKKAVSMVKMLQHLEELCEDMRDPNDAEATRSQTELLGKHTPADDADCTGQGPWQGQIQDQVNRHMTSEEIHRLRSLTAVMQLANDSTWCFANVTVHCLFWALLCQPVADTESWGKHFEPLIQTILDSWNSPVVLAVLPWFKQVLDNWGRPQAQQDCGEFVHIILRWMTSPVIDMHWERRCEQKGRVQCMDQGDQYMPLFLQFPPAVAQSSSCKFDQLILHWCQAYGMQTALTRAAPLLCLHVDRLHEGLNGQIEKSSCAIDIESELTIPVFCNATLEQEHVSYVLIAAASHLGQDAAGHYQAILKIQPVVTQESKPAKWLLTQDNQRPSPIWRAPDLFMQNMTIAWLVRSDCIQIPQYFPDFAKVEEAVDPTQQILALLRPDSTAMAPSDIPQ
ncbi:unnamed protein product [Cladocopium goreaui]|uniref:DNA (cytosine-5-)-methyltransferase n=1 Tax=Cladocopium goreaui TaxID=2562237 RepID=A0A9P1DKE5_9DINO|nr:unnamed protein product [Cladocopium goreaui]